MRIVIKIGTSLLEKDGGVVSGIVREAAALWKSHEVLMVTSGAVHFGMEKLGLKNRPRDINRLQACAAMGQPLLMDLYSREFARHGVNVAQVLLTQEDFAERERHLNLRNALLELISAKAVPIVNENDTVSVREMEGIFSDNDELAALLAIALNADALVLLSNVEGVMRDGKRGSELVRKLDGIDAGVFALADGKSKTGTGGMLSKLRAAKKASLAGVRVIITNGRAKNAIARALAGKAGTQVRPSRRFTGKKNWIAFSAREKGQLLVNDCAAQALRGHSLLAVGIVECRGNFNKGDVVTILDAKGRHVAKGITNYSSAEISAIKGRKSAEIERLMGCSYGGIIYPENMVFFEEMD